MLLSLRRQVMRFVNDINAFFRFRQNSTTAETQISQQQIVINHNNVRPFEPSASFKERALLKVAAAVVTAASMVSGHRTPELVLNTVLPGVDFTIPVPRTKFAEHLLVKRPALTVYRLKRGNKLLLGVALEVVIEPLQTNVALTSFGKCKRKTNACVGLQVGQIAQHHLLLQRDGCRRNYHALAYGLANGNSRKRVSGSFARACPRLDRSNPGFVAGQRASDGRDHLALAPAALEVAGIEPIAVSFLDLGFNLGTERTV